MGIMSLIEDFWVWWNFLVAFLIPGILIIVFGLLNTITLAAEKPNDALYDPKRRLFRNRLSENIAFLFRSAVKTFLKERRITLMMGTITIVFILCVAPYFVYFMAPGKTDFKEKILPYIVMLMYLNSFINPLLYISINASIRKATLKMLCCQKKPQILSGEFLALSEQKFIQEKDSVLSRVLFFR